MHGRRRSADQELSAYLKPKDVKHVREAIEFSRAAHQGQIRQSGDPYISHPIAVARILTPWHLDAQALIAALLHDVMEDTAVTNEQVAEKFGKPVAELVDGLTKLDRSEFETREDAQAENFRKMLLAMARDVRVILIKLADRLHNMRTLDAMAIDKRERIARETLEIYAPIANRLGLNDLYQELQDLSFKYLYPNRYRVLAKALQVARGNRREVVGKILEAIRQRLAESTSTPRSPAGKRTSTASTRRCREDLSFAEVLDIYGFRVMVKDVASCYLALGALHGLYKPIPGKFKDYIAIPKVNGYQSLHTTLFGPFGTPIEIQIRTHEMHKIAEAGVASHWLYKSGRRLDQRPAHEDPPVAAGAAGDARARAATRPNSSNTSRSTCSRTRSTCSRPRARSCRCRAARPAWISPIACTPTSATAASPSRSTMNWCRCAPSSRTATAWKSSPRRTPSPIRPG